MTLLCRGHVKDIHTTEMRNWFGKPYAFNVVLLLRDLFNGGSCRRKTLTATGYSQSVDCTMS